MHEYDKELIAGTDGAWRRWSSDIDIHGEEMGSMTVRSMVLLLDGGILFPMLAPDQLMMEVRTHRPFELEVLPLPGEHHATSAPAAYFSIVSRLFPAAADQ